MWMFQAYSLSQGASLNNLGILAFAISLSLSCCSHITDQGDHNSTSMLSCCWCRNCTYIHCCCSRDQTASLMYFASLVIALLPRGFAPEAGAFPLAFPSWIITMFWLGIMEELLRDDLYDAIWIRKHIYSNALTHLTHTANLVLTRLPLSYPFPFQHSSGHGLLLPRVTQIHSNSNHLGFLCVNSDSPTKQGEKNVLFNI